MRIENMYLLFGQGFNDRKYRAFGEKRPLREYDLWHSMLKRCYDEKTHSRRPTYINTEMSDNFKNYSYFYEWCHDQIGFTDTSFDLDKDLLFKGNSIYSEDNCVFIPYEINGCLTNAKRFRGDLPLGVNLANNKKNPYCASISINKKRIALGHYDCKIKAFNAYKNAKEDRVKSLAEKYKHEIDLRAYNALINYQVEITD